MAQSDGSRFPVPSSLFPRSGIWAPWPWKHGNTCAYYLWPVCVRVSGWKSFNSQMPIDGGEEVTRKRTEREMRCCWLGKGKAGGRRKSAGKCLPACRSTQWQVANARRGTQSYISLGNSRVKPLGNN